MLEIKSNQIRVRILSTVFRSSFEIGVLFSEVLVEMSNTAENSLLLTFKMKSGKKDVKLNPQDLNIFLTLTQDIDLTPAQMQTILTELDNEKTDPYAVLSHGAIERHLQRYKMTEQQLHNMNATNAQTRRKEEARQRRVYGNAAVDKMIQNTHGGGRRKRRTLRKHKRTLRKHKRRTHRR